MAKFFTFLLMVGLVFPALLDAAQDGTGTNRLGSTVFKDGATVTVGGEARTNWPSGAGSGFPLDANGDLAGYALSNGVLTNVTVHGDGVGLTNVPGTETNTIALDGESNVVMRVDGTDVYFGAPDLLPKAGGTMAGDLNGGGNNATNFANIEAIEAWPTNAWSISGATNVTPGDAYSYDVATRTVTVNSNAFGGGGGGDASGWSGYDATQQVSWVDGESVSTNLTLSGSLNPDVTGVYTPLTDYDGHRRWYNDNGYYVWYKGEPQNSYCVNTNSGGDFDINPSWNNASAQPTASYIAGVNATGNITAVYSYPTWKIGYITNSDIASFQLDRDAVAIQNWYVASNVFHAPMYGDGMGLTNLPVTNYDDTAVLAATGSLNTAVGDLQGATNANLTLISTLQDSTNALNTRADNLESATNALNANKLDLAGGTMTGDLDMGGQAMTNASDVKNTAGISMIMPIGSIVQYITSNAPSGWLLCNGAGYHTNTYNALFNVMGYQYGGSTTNFILPDLRNRVPVGLGSGSFASLNARGGYENVTLTTAQMPAHHHAIYHTTSKIMGSGTAQYDISEGTAFSWANIMSDTGGDESHSNMPPYIVLNYIIYAGK